MLTLDQLYQRTTEERKARSQYVKLMQTKVGHTDMGLGFIAARTYSTRKVTPEGNLVRNLNPQHYVSMIVFMDRRLHVHVSCSCADNCFRWETANSYKDAAEIEYSNGEPPNTTNPRYNPGLCKHLVRLYESVRPKLESLKIKKK